MSAARFVSEARERRNQFNSVDGISEHGISELRERIEGTPQSRDSSHGKKQGPSGCRSSVSKRRGIRNMTIVRIPSIPPSLRPRIFHRSSADERCENGLNLRLRNNPAFAPNRSGLRLKTAKVSLKHHHSRARIDRRFWRRIPPRTSQAFAVASAPRSDFNRRFSDRVTRIGTWPLDCSEPLRQMV